VLFHFWIVFGYTKVIEHHNSWVWLDESDNKYLTRIIFIPSP
jgi:hypothetical protein